MFLFIILRWAVSYVCRHLNNALQTVDADFGDVHSTRRCDMLIKGTWGASAVSMDMVARVDMVAAFAAAWSAAPCVHG